MHRSDNGWGEIVYGWIRPSTNSFFADTWGGSEESLNSMYPSIAPFGMDSTDENFLIAFLRTGPTIFPELCVINYDSGFSPVATVVKQGLGLIDQRTEYSAPWDSLERIGDYTAIQRRYNAPNRACWLSGSYAAGPMPNFFGVTDGISAWIAEVGDSALVSSRPEPIQRPRFVMFPNPPDPQNPELSIQLPAAGEKGCINVTDFQGKTVAYNKFSGASFSMKLPNLPNGLYLVSITSNKNRYETQKLLIHR